MTTFLLWVMRLFNRKKNRCLAQRLYDLAEEYNPDPGEYITRITSKERQVIDFQSGAIAWRDGD